jgi:WD40-like Beta Propeller Repeat/RTX calcium-binding nonapeptide repeat (4 copies)
MELGIPRRTRNDARVGQPSRTRGRRRRDTSLAALGAAGAALLVLAPASGFPGSNGRIVFETDRTGDAEVYIMNSDGGSPANLTNSPATVDHDPVASASGGQIAFERDGQVWKMNADGSGAIQLTTDGGTQPAWSPDGGQIAFVRGDDVWIMSSADGSGATNLTNDAAADTSPAWSPDGTQIVFTSNRDGNLEVYLMTAAGASPTNLSGNAADDVDPSWSPDGSKIAFVSNRDANAELYVMNASGTGQTRLTDDAFAESSPSWSPDGTLIAFAATDDTNTEVYTVAATGGSPNRLTSEPGFDGEPDWRVGLANTALPTISGTATQGSTLTATQGTWTSPSSITYAYEWQRCNSSGASCVAIAGATGTTYVLTSTDVGSTIRVAVTATSADGSATVQSTQTAVVTASGAPVNTALPTISGSASVGSVLTSLNGTWTGTGITYTRQWQRCDANGNNCVAIGATGTTYTLTSTDLGSALRVVVTATSSAGSANATSAATAVIAAASAPSNSIAPSVSGTPRVGSVLTALRGTWSPTTGVTFTYQWQRCDASGGNCANIAGATSASYTAISTDLNSRLRVVVTGSNASGSQSATSAATVAVTAATTSTSGTGTGTGTGTTSTFPRNVTLPRVTGTLVQGSTLTASPGSWTGSAPLTYTYQWARCDDQDEDDCDDIAGATRSTYTLVSRDVGSRIRVAVTAANSAGDETETSDVTDVVKATGNTASGGRSGAAAKTIKGTKRADVILGTSGNDTILPGPGADTVVAGDGNDVINSVDGFRDVIVCGAGVDRVTADQLDVTRECEVVTRIKTKAKPAVKKRAAKKRAKQKPKAR